MVNMYKTVSGLLGLWWALHPIQPSLAQGAFKDCAQCPGMMIVSAGTFEMGSRAEENVREESPERYITWESPVHSVRIPKSFAVGVSEVTRGEFGAFVSETNHLANTCDIAKGNDWERRADKSWRDPDFVQDDRHPVVCVDWHDAKAYAQWLAVKTGKPYRLLSEAEWEYITRGGTSTARFWGDGRDGACQYANVPDQTHTATTGNQANTFSCQDGFAFTSPAKSFAANAFGLYDTIGNVWEWVEDCFQDSYIGAPDGGSAWKPDPNCQYHVARGGSWNPRLATQLRAAARGRVTTMLKNSNLGFRIALTLEPK
ncbi:MAG: formylglycine-generating enzyme family protein [Rhodospirillaceae bacterium]|nr:formylglycine-generating enzyme family protein [Rhodospirillaceae bacterium]